MIKKYTTYVNEANNEELTPVLKIALRQNIPYDKITEMYCSDNKLTSLEGIEKLVNLKYLFCYSNKLTSLRGIENLVNLKSLYCSNNQLTSLEGIENLINLERLNCSYNKLISLDGIENLSKLKYIDCVNNNFSEDYKKYLKNYYDTLNIFIYNEENKIILDI